MHEKEKNTLNSSSAFFFVNISLITIHIEKNALQSALLYQEQSFFKTKKENNSKLNIKKKKKIKCESH